mgnify:CR=1 FL=1
MLVQMSELCAVTFALPFDVVKKFTHDFLSDQPDLLTSVREKTISKLCKTTNDHATSDALP